MAKLDADDSLNYAASTFGRDPSGATFIAKEPAYACAMWICSAFYPKVIRADDSPVSMRYSLASLCRGGPPVTTAS